MGRFINLDGFITTGTGFLGHNMFAYCNNNSVMFIDPTGDLFKKIQDFCDIFIEIAEIIITSVSLFLMGFNDYSFENAKDCRDALLTYEIDTPEEKAHFFAQCYVEGNTSILEAGYLPDSIAEDYRKSQRYYPYYGAGYIQLTWDYNYKSFSEAMNDPLIYSEGPKYVAEHYPWSSAGWFWDNNNINSVIMNGGGSVSDVTLIVNGGYSQLNEREQMHQLYYSYWCN